MSIIILFLTDILVPILLIWSRKTMFTKANLQSDEEVIAVGKTHWIVFSLILILQIIITLFCVYLIWGTNNSDWSSTLILIVLFVMLWSQVVTQCREFVITNKRIILKVGLISRETKEFRYEKMESCDVKQGIAGRLLGYGTIVVRGVGGNTIKEPYVKDPFPFRQYLIDRIV